MYSLIRKVLYVMIFITAGIGMAQEDSSIYADIPQSRGEDGAFILGAPEAPVTVIEFADYLCPHCQTYEEVTAQFIEKFVTTGLARFEYRMFPIIDNTYSPLLAAINECAAAAGKFWEARELLFHMAQNGEVGSTITEDVAERLGIDTEILTACIPDAVQYETDLVYGQDLGVTGTPAIRVRVGDDYAGAGAIELDGVEYSRGGAPLDILRTFVESENPEELVTLLNQLRDDNLLHDTSLATNEPCRAPCWNSITVGETLWEDALEILENTDGYSEIQIEEAQQSSAKRATWGMEDGDLCCEVITLDGETVAYIRLLLAPQVTLGELIKTQGEPAYLIGSEQTTTQAVFSLFYPDVPMLVFAFVAGAAEGVLSETSEIIGVQYLTPSDMASILANNQFLIWDGYKSYQEYLKGELVSPEVDSEQNR